MTRPTSSLSRNSAASPAARSGPDTAALSGMAQGYGYLIAAPGPLLFGLLHDLTAAWTVPLIVFTVVVVAQSVFGGLAGRDRYV